MNFKNYSFKEKINQILLEFDKITNQSDSENIKNNIKSMLIDVKNNEEYHSKYNESFNSTELWKRIFDNIPSMIGYWDYNQINIICNQSYSNYFGKSPSNIIGHHMEEVLGKDLYLKNLPFIQKVLEGSAQSFEREIITPNGQSKYTVANYIPDFNNNKIEGFYVIVTDITDIKILENQNNKIQTSYRIIFENAPIGMTQLNSNYEFISANPKFCNLLEYSEDELKKKNIFEVTHPDDKEKTKDAANKFIDKMSTNNFIEKRYLTKTGKIIWVKIYTETFFDNNLKDYIFISTVEDVTNIKESQIEMEKIQKALFESQSLLKLTLDYLPGAVSSKNKEGKYNFINKKFKFDFNIPQGDITQKSDFDIFPKEVAEGFRNNDLTILNTRSLLNFKRQIPNYKGNICVYDIYMFPVINTDYQIVSITTILYDITEKIELEKSLLLEKEKVNHNSRLASLGEMAAGIVHEINNPLTIIDGNIKMLEILKDNPIKFSEKLKSMEKASERIIKIIRGLRKFSRSNYQNEYRLELFSEILNEVLIMIEEKAKQSFVQLKLDIAPNIFIFCNLIEIEQVIVNLLNNAIDAIQNLEEKWVKINLFKNKGQAILQIIDSGNGISKESEEKIFQPFFTTKAIGEGTGLGLAIVKGILEQHKASIHLNHNFKNTCFEIFFPLNNEDAHGN
ncbi:PAS domain S-box protein [Silvanigrella paludirubra]|uniref:histidine kinase n=1 Tax=Silvanigrella paludirubra TaxID=2499159 RepID=A0A6N6VW71_9BACT|nr:PAS domain S-box protein [Silvanigrella paludirubra]KAB8039677.1 PAS domain S-box protein [Silvanigrella paludirubra]